MHERGLDDLVDIYSGRADRFDEDDPQIVGWRYGAPERHEVMLEIVRERDEPLTLLDVGCGVGHLADHLARAGRPLITLSAVELNPEMAAIARRRHPEVPVYEVDILTGDGEGLPVFDYVVMNGLLTYRGIHGVDQMLEYLSALLRAAFRHARRGIAFNTMSIQVDAPRDELLHLPIDTVVSFAARELSRHIVVRHDYGLYQYTTYVYREPAFDSMREMPRLVGASASAEVGRSWFKDDNDGLQRRGR